MDERAYYAQFDGEDYIDCYVEEIQDKLAEYFVGYPIIVEKEQDPENGMEYYTVRAHVTDMPVDDAIATLDRFDDEWWFENYKRFLPHNIIVNIWMAD